MRSGSAVLDADIAVTLSAGASAVSVVLDDALEWSLLITMGWDSATAAELLFSVSTAATGLMDSGAAGCLLACAVGFAVVTGKGVAETVASGAAVSTAGGVFTATAGAIGLDGAGVDGCAGGRTETVAAVLEVPNCIHAP